MRLKKNKSSFSNKRKNRGNIEFPRTQEELYGCIGIVQN